MGIAICGTGIGMSIALNKIRGVYCAKVSNISEAVLCRQHNDANAIWLYLASNRGILTNAAEPISFSEFKYFTGVS